MTLLLVYVDDVWSTGNNNTELEGTVKVIVNYSQILSLGFR